MVAEGLCLPMDPLEICLMVFVITAAILGIDDRGAAKSMGGNGGGLRGIKLVGQSGEGLLQLRNLGGLALDVIGQLLYEIGHGKSLLFEMRLGTGN